ncbi:ArnT family glycosyltransferase [Herminiimonas sp. NPDC097707]|uniref:ArnT family glycosyltransferase n=1 Tax=Herminiimonas sp. NPDC097707 TaxID=3364007 RepID=UPI00383B675C
MDQQVVPAFEPHAVPANNRTRSISLRISQNYLWWLLGAALLLLAYRIGLMLVLPLADTTEARYGEIARLTVSNGFWLMPHIDPHTPFFAKPPLSTWVSAASMMFFGINEFAARLPALLASLVALWFAWAFAGELQIRQRWLVAPVLATSPLFFLCAGAVMTDAVQLMLISAALYFAWRALKATADRQAGRRWRLAFWAMVGLGALCKGLATWALIGLPLFAYAIIERRPLQMFKDIFDWVGVVIALGIFMPWYIAAEYYNPGFINYFIVGEHFSRFLVPGWKGDRYGIAQKQPLGAIWIFWVIGILPWIGIFATELSRMLFKRRKQLLPVERFLWCATLAPLLFFTFSSNIIWTYGLTAALPFAVLAARWLDHAPAPALRRTSMAVLAIALLSIMCAPVIISNAGSNSDRDLIAAYHHAAKQADAELLYRTPPAYSSTYYTKGTLEYPPDATRPHDARKTFVVIERKDIHAQSIDPSRILFTGKFRALIAPE